jgi:hypothetical protein
LDALRATAAQGSDNREQELFRTISAEPLPQCRLKVTFNDSVSGVFPVEPERRGGVFLKLLDARVFNAVTVNPDFGCVEWPGGVDLCPDAMHQAMTGSESEAEIDSAEGAPRKTSSLSRTVGPRFGSCSTTKTFSPIGVKTRASPDLSSHPTAHRRGRQYGGCR